MISPSLKDSIRFNVLYPLNYVSDLLRARCESRRRPCRILLVSDGRAYTSEQQFLPLRRYRSYLRRHLGVILTHQRLKDALAAQPRILSAYDGIIVKLYFLIPESAAVDILKTLRQKSAPAKLLYFDGDDDLCVQWPSALDQVDLYVKKHVFADPAAYLGCFIGKSNLTDHVARTQGWSFENNAISKSGPVDPQYLYKIALGYNVALDEKIIRLYKNAPRVCHEEAKDIDIFCRASFAENDWIRPFRAPVLEILRSLNQYSTVLPDKRVNQKQYYSEMRRSRICVSPFGYGEICWRDFEAILCGCLLVKPDMGHVRTEPNVFIPGETYVPVRWDFGDLADTCQRYLSDHAELRRISRRAYEVLADYYDNVKVVTRFRELLALTGLNIPAVSAATDEGEGHAI
jgi:hypothetical protein